MPHINKKVRVIINIDKRKRLEHKGIIKEIHDIFIRIWLESNGKKGWGWNECFLIRDIGKTVLIKDRNGYLKY